MPIYDAGAVRARVRADGSDRPTRDELAGVLHEGPGIFVLARSFEPDVVDRATAEFNSMIARQHAEGRQVGDHYAKPGANDRVWNAIEKLAVQAPDVFVDYYANDMVALRALAWLGAVRRATTKSASICAARSNPWDASRACRSR